QNLVIRGLNTWMSTVRVGWNSLDVHLGQTYLHSANAKSPIRDTRSSPYAGIAIDPFTALPAPDPNAPPDIYPGLADRYMNGSGCPQVSIENCGISGFAVGIAISLNQLSVDVEDAIAITNCSIVETKAAVAIGKRHTHTTISNITVWAAECMINGIDY